MILGDFGTPLGTLFRRFFAPGAFFSALFHRSPANFAIFPGISPSFGVRRRLGPDFRRFFIDFSSILGAPGSLPGPISGRFSVDCGAASVIGFRIVFGVSAGFLCLLFGRF